MSNLFFQYLDQRFHKTGDHITKKRKGIESIGPIITISKQAGCSANEISNRLYQAINKNIRKSAVKWKCVDKKIIVDSAKKLDLAPDKIQYVFNSQRKSTMDDILESLSSRYYKSDKKIRKTIVEVMKGFAEDGNTIIVGRAGVALSQHVKRSFNIRLIAPIEWRILQISRKHEISEEDAKKYINKMDFQRTTLIEEFYGKKMDDSMFDLIFNCESISKNEIVNISLRLLKEKGMI